MDGRGSSAATRTDGRMIEAPTRPGTADRTASAQRGLITYLVVVMVLSAVLEGVMIASRLDALVILLMWIPGLTAIGVRLVRHEGFGDVSFRFGGPIILFDDQSPEDFFCLSWMRLRGVDK